MGICMTLEYLLQRKMRHWYPSVQHIWTAAWLLGAVILLQASSLLDLQENLTVLFGRGRLIQEQDQYLLFNGGLELAAVLALLMVLPKWKKTAYESPKRDWSSDVCSSDLMFLFCFSCRRKVICQSTQKND